jgi:hypothetical protein
MLFNEFTVFRACHEHRQHKITSLDENKAYHLIDKDQSDDIVNIKAVKIHF